MSSFDTLESSLESSQPLEIFEIVIGSEPYFYTSAEDTITISGVDYVPEAIARNNIQQTAEDRNREMVITVPAANPVAALYRNVVPSDRASVTVIRLQRSESPVYNTQALQFKGQLKSVRFSKDGQTAEIVVRSVEGALNENIPRFTFMGMCNNTLYDDACGVSTTSFNFIGAVSAVTGSVITVTGLSASALDFVGGFCQPTVNSDFRMVIARSGSDLTLLLPFAEDITGGDVQVFAGCDRLMEGDCTQVFDNGDRFGGFHLVPNRNPFQDGLESI